MSFTPIYFDTETTGLRAENDRIIELAAYNAITKATFECLINPQMPIPKEASAVHKIYDEMVVGSPTFKDIVNSFVEFCGPNAILIAHNNESFDKLFIEAEFARAGTLIPSGWQYLDTLKWARKYRSDLPKHALQYLREIYGIQANNAHRALDDVIVLKDVFEQMIDDLTFEEIIECMKQTSTTPQKLTTMPFGKHQGMPLENLPPSYAKWLAQSGALDKPDNAALKQKLQELGLIK